MSKQLDRPKSWIQCSSCLQDSHQLLRGKGRYSWHKIGISLARCYYTSRQICHGHEHGTLPLMGGFCWKRRRALPQARFRSCTSEQDLMEKGSPGWLRCGTAGAPASARQQVMKDSVVRSFLHRRCVALEAWLSHSTERHELHRESQTAHHTIVMTDRWCHLLPGEQTCKVSAETSPVPAPVPVFEPSCVTKPNPTSTQRRKYSSLSQAVDGTELHWISSLLPRLHRLLVWQDGLRTPHVPFDLDPENADDYMDFYSHI